MLAVAMFLLAAGMTAYWAWCLKAGWVYAKGVVDVRAKNPVGFWYTMALLGIFDLMCWFVAVSAWLHPDR